jgi:hypothetical protein
MEERLMTTRGKCPRIDLGIALRKWMLLAAIPVQIELCLSTILQLLQLLNSFPHFPLRFRGKSLQVFSSRKPTWRNWQTRWTQNPVHASECGFDPLRR